MRDPILHITVSNLAKVLRQANNSEYPEAYYEDVAFTILKLSKPYQLKSMYIIKSSGRTKTKLEKTVAAESQWVEKFNGILASMRLQANHRNAKPIRKNDRDYIMLKEVTQLGLEFAADFNIEFKEEAFKYFIATGIEIMGKKYAINKFKYYKNRIVERFEAIEIISKDNNKQASKQFYQMWKVALAKYANSLIDIESEEDYSHIVLARMEADEYKADYKQWIFAQFEELAFLDAIPSMNQLYGINAVKRYHKYTTTRKKEVNKSEEIKFASTDEEKYFKLLRQRKADRGDQ